MEAQWHPNQKGLYWFEQGKSHVYGDKAKSISVSNAERCFREGIKFDDNGCRYFLAIMIATETINESVDGELELLIDDLVAKNLIEESDKKDLFGIGEDESINIFWEKASSKLPEDLLDGINPYDFALRGFSFDLRYKMECKLKGKAKAKRLKTEEELDSMMAGDLIKLCRDYKIIDRETADKLFEITRYVGEGHKKRLTDKTHEKLREWTELVKRL